MLNKDNIIKTLQYEKLSVEEIAELNWLLTCDHYRERPVSIQEFCSSTEFVAKKWPNIYPLWKQTLSELYPTPFNAPYNEVLISAAAGGGKCLGYNTPILMYDGTIKMVQDIQVGDQLMGPDSKPRNVLSTCTGTEQVYEIQPNRGGINWQCNASHILSLKCGYGNGYPNGKYEKDRIINMSVKEYLQQNKNFKNIMRLWRTGVDFPNSQSLEIDPYIYGLWLGDGSTSVPELTTMDEAIEKEWWNYGERLDLVPRIAKEKKAVKCKRIYLASKTGLKNSNPIMNLIKESTQTGHKRILQRYKTASRENRLKLLAGIIDTDGYKTKGSNKYEITTKYEDLLDDYIFVARSLGFRVGKRKKDYVIYQGKKYPAYSMSISGNISQIPVKLERKKSVDSNDGDVLKTNFKIEDKGIGQYYGFTIDGDHLFMLGDFTVTHNTTTATIGVLYDMYKLACLKDPCAFYNLTSGTMLIFAVFSATGSTAAVNWQDITTGIESCPWMMNKLVDKRGLEKKNGSLVPVEIMPGIFIQSGSKFQHSMGKAIFDGLMDEAAFGGSNLKDAQKTYSELSSRMATRFRSYSKTGNLPGHLFLISSPKEAGDFMQYRIEIAEKTNSKFTLVKKNISSWDANPANDSEDKFTVFIGNETAEPKIYEENETPSIDDLDYLIYPPTSYYEEFKKDILGSIMNYGGITAMTDMALFKSTTTLNNAFMLTNPFKSDVVKLPFAKSDKQLIDYADLEYFKDIRHPEYNRFIHIDAAYSANTIDVYGLSAGYCIYTDNNPTGNSADSEEEFEKRERLYFIDFAVGIDAEDGQEVPLYKIQDFIEYLVKKLHYPVACVSADTFQSKQTLQNLEALSGLDTQNISVDRSRDPYLFFKNLVTNGQVLLPKNEYLKQELKKLRDDGKRCDHPINFHKDIADSCAGALWSCANSTKILNTGRIARNILSSGAETQYYSPEKAKAQETAEFEAMRQQFATNIFKNL